jgi:hypothetical protein
VKRVSVVKRSIKKLDGIKLRKEKNEVKVKEKGKEYG